VIARERLELTHQPVVLAESELRIDPVLGGGEAQLLEPLDVDACERLELQVGQRPPAPQPLRLAQGSRGQVVVTRLFRPPSFFHELLEAPQIELTGRDTQDVSRRSRDERRAVRAECLPKPRNVHLHRVARRRRRVVGPQLLDEAIARHDPIRAQQQHREERALPRTTQREALPVRADFERTKDSKVHCFEESLQSDPLTIPPAAPAPPALAGAR
jgi:hypothetical protein